MKAIEFEAPIRDGVIPIPPQYRHENFSPLVRVILLSETAVESAPANPPFRLVPPIVPPGKIVRPDYVARAREIFGDSPPMPNPILIEREESRW